MSNPTIHCGLPVRAIDDPLDPRVGEPITLARTEQIVEVQRLLQSSLAGWVFAAQDAKGNDLSFLAPPAYGLWLYDQLQAEGPFPLVIDEHDALS